MKALLAIAVFFLFIATANASLVNWTADVSINDDGGADWVATLTYNETVQRSDYFVLSRAINIDVVGDSRQAECVSSYSLGTSIVCEDIWASHIIYKFHTKNLVSDLQNYKIFRYPFSITQPVDRVHVVVKFPLGSALVEELKLGGTGLKPFEPDFGREGTDGRRIFVAWTFDKPALGQSLNIYAIYELLSGFDPFTVFLVILVLIIIVFVAFMMFFFKKQKVRDLLPVLEDGERKVMEILLREKGEVDQRVIVKETDFSKPKVSRIIGNLMHRGLVEKHARGRKNLIKLKKEVKRGDSTQGQKSGEKS